MFVGVDAARRGAGGADGQIGKQLWGRQLAGAVWMCEHLSRRHSSGVCDPGACAHVLDRHSALGIDAQHAGQQADQLRVARQVRVHIAVEQAMQTPVFCINVGLASR
ncbi:hypothetical protein HK405_006898 [Cladochytrium tenue]|nr:hypothetical protein HK405_006898 [Cladochytrium tenue]